MPQPPNRPILDPYRTLGTFISGKISLSSTTPISLTIPTNNSYKIYSDTLSIKVVSPPLIGKVQSVISYNQYSYVKVTNKIIKMKYHHVVKQWELKQSQYESQQNKAVLMKFDQLVILAQGRQVFVIDDQKNNHSNNNSQIQIFELPHNNEPFISMIHPITYINKVLIYSKHYLKLINPISSKILYEYPNFTKYLKQLSTQIITVQSSKLVNIIAISLTNGEIIIFNIKKDQIVFKMKLKQPAITIAFCDEEALMATADQEGNVVLWDLEKRKYYISPIDSLVFIPGHPILTCGSSQQNSIKQLRINLQDNRILTLFRQRNGITEAITKISLLSNTQLTISSKSQTLFTSLYSHTNNYKLPYALSTSSPFHIIPRHFSILLYNNQSLQKTFNIHQTPLIGKISISQKYYVIATKSRLIKLGAQNLQAKINGIKDILLFNQHFIYVITDNQILVLDFATFQVLKDLEIGKCTRAVKNQFGTFYSQTNQTIQIYDMQRIQLARQYPSSSQPLCLCFTSDNHYLLSSQSSPSLQIFSILNNNIFKSFTLQKPITSMTFTSDNQFFLSVYQNEREINIWNNYIGKLLSNRKEEQLMFHVKINKCEEDFRIQLMRLQQENKFHGIDNQQDNLQDYSCSTVLDSIPNSIDSIPEYAFKHTQKYLPLIYYDQIKQRNTIQMNKQVSMPFFLDFKNIDQQKKKIQKQLKDELKNKRKQQQDKIDKHLKNQSHQIRLSQQSTQQEYINCIFSLQQLSIAQIDYLLRTFLLNPSNKHHILEMFFYIFNKHNSNTTISEQFKNILFHRVLYLIGNQIFDNQIKDKVKKIHQQYKDRLDMQKQKVDKCIVIVEKIMGQ